MHGGSHHAAKPSREGWIVSRPLILISTTTGRGAVRHQYVRPHHRRGVAAAAAARPRLRRARAAAAPRDEGRARRDALPHSLRGGARAGAGAPVPLPRVRRQWQRQGFVGAHTTARSVPPRHAASSTVRISMRTACCIGWDGRGDGYIGVTAGATAPLLQEPRQGGARRGAR